MHFEFHLAYALHKTHKELLATMGDDEMEYWMAYHRIHNIFPDKIDQLAAMIAWSNAAPWSRDAKFADFLPKWDVEAVQQSNKAKLHAWVKGLPKAKSK